MKLKFKLLLPAVFHCKYSVQRWDGHKGEESSQANAAAVEAAGRAARPRPDANRRAPLASETQD